MTTAIVLFRQDLRLKDHAALSAACAAADKIIPVYIFDETSGRPMGGAQRWWLHHSLSALDQSLKKHQSKLILQQGPQTDTLKKLCKTHNVSAIFWHRSYDPELIARDKKTKATLEQEGVAVHSFPGYLLNEPWNIKNKSGSYFKVFTPYWRCAKQQIAFQAKHKLSKVLPTLPQSVKSDRLNSWELLPKNWQADFATRWEPGEDSAHKKLRHFLKNAIDHYKIGRDRPDQQGTSELSPHIHFGEISPLQIYHAVEEKLHEHTSNANSIDVYLSEIGWREFSYNLLFHFPQLPKKNFKAAFNHFDWKKSKTALKQWQQGKTGYPIVDAGMIELYKTGYMHNRVRMIVASFLTKDLHIDWREGEKWFWDCLLDADIASNAAGWQWTAGSGADASPYFRVFNPITQGEKFDPDGLYVKKWLPALKHIPTKKIHAPWKLSEEEQQNYQCILGKDYPTPIVDHAYERKVALALYQKLKST